MTKLRQNRRQFLGTTAATLAAAGLYAPAVHAQSRVVRVGYVTPQTGPLAAFAEVDEFIINGVLEALSGGIASGGTTFTLEVIVKDSQSNPNRAAEVARELIIDDEIDIMLVGNTPETTNPVSTICEIEEIPCISSLAPWQPWFIGRQGQPGRPVDMGRVRLHLPRLLGSGGRHRRLHQHVEPA
jgi:branched-chain amino acid transport system substrate-binding protein